MSIIGGIAFGVLWGYLLKYVPEKNDPFVVPLRVLLLLLGGLLAVLGSELIEYDGAGEIFVKYLNREGFLSNVSMKYRSWTVIAVSMHYIGVNSVGKEIYYIMHKLFKRQSFGVSNISHLLSKTLIGTLYKYTQ